VSDAGKSVRGDETSASCSISTGPPGRLKHASDGHSVDTQALRIDPKSKYVAVPTRGEVHVSYSENGGLSRIAHSATVPQFAPK
jgi:hypothetical protein